MEIIDPPEGIVKHDWDSYVDGKWRRATHGVDFHGRPSLFRHNVGTQANRRNATSQTRVNGNNVEFCITPRD
jgi:hypothetical protein